MNVSEGYMVSFDISSNKDESVMMVFERNENTLSLVKMVEGQEVIDLYEKLTNKLNEERKN
jgi:glucokinase